MKVSVIVPVYSVSAYIERSIRSVMNQTYDCIECIVVDDATLDDSIVKCKRLIDEYEGPICFRIFHHEYNRGLSESRNTGTIASTGDYIFYLDSDDEIMPDCIGKLVKVAEEHPEAEMVIGNYEEISEGKQARIKHDERLPAHIQTNERFVSYYHHHQISFAAWNKLIKRSFINSHCLFFKEGILYEDYLWMFYVAKYLSVVFIVKEVTYRYYIRPGSITMSSDHLSVGRSYMIIFDDILHHLTIGREKKELNYCAERFCKHYLNSKKKFPAYKSLYRLYLKLTLQYHSLYANIVLVFIGVLGLFGNPMTFLLLLHSLRWKMTRLIWNDLMSVSR